MYGEWVVPGYRHTGMLGEGASGHVVRAEHLETGTAVAIKYLDRRLLRDEEFLNRFRSEARLLADLRDPNLVRLYEYVEAPWGAAIVMELVNGVSLATLLQAEGPTEPEAALVVLKGSLLGLAAAHAAGVVHRDYKPGNVLVAGDGSSKLADFGVAVPAGEDVPVSGTPAYMAPEQWSGAPVGPAADVYAATAVFYECLTGERPYTGETLPQLALAHRSAEIPADRVPEPLGGLVERGMAKDPRRRPPSAHAFLGELEAVASGAYGEEWEAYGHERLIQRAALLALLFPLNRPADAAGTAVGHTELGDGPVRAEGWVRGRRRLGVAAAAVAVGLLVGGGAAVVFAGQDAPKTPVALESSTPTGGPGAAPGGAPSASPLVSPGQSHSPTPTVAPTGTGGTGPHGGAPSPAPVTSTRPAIPHPFQVTGVHVAVSRATGSRTGSFTVTVSTKGRPAKPVHVTITLGRGLQSDSPGAVTLSAPSYSATYSLSSGCGPSDTGWTWTVTAAADGESGTGGTPGPYWPRDKMCG